MCSIRAKRKKDRLIHKSHPGAFEQTGLAKELQARRVNRLIVTGLVSHGCVRATCLNAKKRGYEVVLVEDGHSNYHRQAAKVVAEVNEALANAGAELRAAAVIRF
jgi:nicotinamidase-related amidase